MTTSIPSRMRAVGIAAPGGPDALRIEERAVPTPRAGEVLVRVRAAGVNRADLLQRRGHYPPPKDAPQEGFGLELAGEVAALGDGVTEWRVGDRVMGIVGNAAQAEYAVTRADALARVPNDMGWAEAGGAPEVFITAHDAMVTQGRVMPNEYVLIHAVGSGVGLAAVQLARAFGAIPFGTARTADKIDRARKFGLEDGVVIGDDPKAMIEATRRFTKGRGVDLTLDLVGGDYFAASVLSATTRGRIILIGTLAGAQATVSLRDILGRRLTIRGTALRSRSPEEKAQATDAFARDVVPLFAARELHVPIDSTFALDDIAAAHARVESNETFGKVVITL